MKNTIRSLFKEAEFRIKSPIVDFALKRTLPSPYLRQGNGNLSFKRNFIFIHVPKTAGTSICTALGWQPGHIPASRFWAFDKARFYESERIAFSRHPAHRLLSAYNYLHSAIGINKSPDVLWADENLGKYSTFLEFLKALEDKKNRRKILSYIHFRPQSDWIKIPGETEHCLTWMGRFETIDTDIVKLQKLLGADLQVDHLRKPQSPKKEIEWTPEMHQIVEDIYHEDYQNLGYDRHRAE